MLGRAKRLTLAEPPQQVSLPAAVQELAVRSLLVGPWARIEVATVPDAAGDRGTLRARWRPPPPHRTEADSAGDAADWGLYVTVRRDPVTGVLAEVRVTSPRRS